MRVFSRSSSARFPTYVYLFYTARMWTWVYIDINIFRLSVFFFFPSPVLFHITTGDSLGFLSAVPLGLALRPRFPQRRNSEVDYFFFFFLFLRARAYYYIEGLSRNKVAEKGELKERKTKKKRKENEEPAPH